MIQQPQLVLCRALVPAMLLPGSNDYLDDGIVYDMAGRTRPFMPDKLGGESIFTRLWLITTTFAGNVALYVTPYVDGVALATQQVNLLGAANPDNKQRVTELALSVPYLHLGVEKMRNAPRGRVIDVKVATNVALAGSSSRQIVDGIEVECEMVENSVKATV